MPWDLSYFAGVSTLSISHGGKLFSNSENFFSLLSSALAIYQMEMHNNIEHL